MLSLICRPWCIPASAYKNYCLWEGIWTLLQVTVYSSILNKVTTVSVQRPWKLRSAFKILCFLLAACQSSFSHMVDNRNDTSWKIICSNCIWVGSWFSIRTKTQELWECLVEFNCFGIASVVLWKAIPRSPELPSLYMSPAVWKLIETIQFAFSIWEAFLCAINSNNTQNQTDS